MRNYNYAIMNMMNMGRRFILPLIAMASLLHGFSNSIAAATAYQPGETVRIISGDAASGEDMIEWAVTLEKTGPESVSMSFTMDDSDQPVCRLEIDASGAKLLWKNPERQPQVVRQGDLLIAPGSPVPCDMLPPDMLVGRLNSKNYEVKRQVGGQSFVDRFMVTSVGVDRAQACADGWVTEENAPDKLVMVTVVNERTGALVVRQLWAPGADWWIYEETAYRQSWRVR